ncbi:hypothetical protein [Nostoc sp. FACHB-888]|nr:hypothetical protein [Nostoc sp. FACHB-888]
MKADQEGEVSTAPVLNAEKWSHEAIVAFVKALAKNKSAQPSLSP